MSNSQNLLFGTDLQIRSDEHAPPGEELIDALRNELLQHDLGVDETDNWRDCGWSMTCRDGDSALEIVLCQTPDNLWILQIAPLCIPGFFGRLLGRTPSATAESTHRLALLVHQVLSTKLGMTKSLWRWDGFPDEKTGTELPQNV